MRSRSLFSVSVLVAGLAMGAAPAVAVSPPAFDVLCDSVAGSAYCHPAHPGGRVLTYSELRTRINTFGAGRMSVMLVSGETRLGRNFELLDTALRVGRDTIPLRETRYIFMRASWPQWSSVASLAAGGTLLFGGVGLVVDGVQWMAGGDADLVSAMRGSIVGAALFGGLGLWLARDEVRVVVQAGKKPETVDAPPMYEHRAFPVASTGFPSASHAATVKSAW